MTEINEINCVRVWNSAFDGAISVFGATMRDAKNAEDIAGSAVIKFITGEFDDAEHLEAFSRKMGVNSALNAIKRDKVLHAKSLDLAVFMDSIREHNSATLEEVVGIAQRLSASIFNHMRPTATPSEYTKVLILMMLKDTRTKLSTKDSAIAKRIRVNARKNEAIKADFYQILKNSSENISFSDMMGATK